MNVSAVVTPSKVWNDVVVLGDPWKEWKKRVERLGMVTNHLMSLIEIIM